MKINIRKIWQTILLQTPIILAVITLIVVGTTLNQKLNICRSDIRTDIITISGVLSGIIIAYLTSKVLQIRTEKIERLPELNRLTQQLHRFRAIVNKLLYSNLWVNGLQNFVNQKYKGLSFYDIRDIASERKTKEQVLNFSGDEPFGYTPRLFLELKSFISENIPFDDTLYSEFDIHVRYNSKILEKWIRYDCGNGLWYYFDHKYHSYRNDLNLANVNQGFQEEIENFAIQIDKERYGKINFSNDLLAKLGTQVHADIIPKLYQLQLSIEKGLPSIINYLFVILCLLIVFGVSLPLLAKAYSWSPFFDVVSVSVVASLCVYFVTSFYSFLKNEIRV